MMVFFSIAASYIIYLRVSGYLMQPFLNSRCQDLKKRYETFYSDNFPWSYYYIFG
jgi:hypothetical protein